MNTATATVPTTNRRKLRSVGAVAAGFVVVFALSTAMDAAMHGLGVFPPVGETMSGALFAWATAYRVAFTVAGGWVTARLAPSRLMAHAVALGIVGTVAGLIPAVILTIVLPMTGGQAADALGPVWYPWALVVTALPACWLGGKLLRNA